MGGKGTTGQVWGTPYDFFHFVLTLSGRHRVSRPKLGVRIERTQVGVPLSTPQSSLLAYTFLRWKIPNICKGKQNRIMSPYVPVSRFGSYQLRANIYFICIPATSPLSTSNYLRGKTQIPYFTGSLQYLQNTRTLFYKHKYNIIASKNYSSLTSPDIVSVQISPTLSLSSLLVLVFHCWYLKP